MGSKIHAFRFWRFLFRWTLEAIEGPPQKNRSRNGGVFPQPVQPRWTRPSPTKIHPFVVESTQLKLLGSNVIMWVKVLHQTKTPCFEQPEIQGLHLIRAHLQRMSSRWRSEQGLKLSWWENLLMAEIRCSPIEGTAVDTRYLIGFFLHPNGVYCRISEPSTVSLWAKNDSFFNMSRCQHDHPQNWVYRFHFHTFEYTPWN